MGAGTNLVRMLGLPEIVKCPKCGDAVVTFFGDYDMDAGDPNPENGVWNLELECHECEHVWEERYVVEALPIEDGEEEEA